MVHNLPNTFYLQRKPTGPAIFFCALHLEVCNCLATHSVCTLHLYHHEQEASVRSCGKHSLTMSAPDVGLVTCSKGHCSLHCAVVDGGVGTLADPGRIVQNLPKGNFMQRYADHAMLPHFAFLPQVYPNPGLGICVCSCPGVLKRLPWARHVYFCIRIVEMASCCFSSRMHHVGWVALWPFSACLSKTCRRGIFPTPMNRKHQRAAAGLALSRMALMSACPAA